mgnify:CR=1 FL=1
MIQSKTIIKFTELQAASDPFRFKISDVREYSEWASLALCRLLGKPKSRINLHQIGPRAAPLLAKEADGVASGEVAFFLSQDRKRARALICFSVNPPIWATAVMNFGRCTPELIISVWLSQVLNGSKRREVNKKLKQDRKVLRAVLDCVKTATDETAARAA